MGGHAEFLRDYRRVDPEFVIQDDGKPAFFIGRQIRDRSPGIMLPQQSLEQVVRLF
jgi:hypothetical protein